MKATLENGIIVEGTPAEIAEVIRHLGIHPSNTIKGRRTRMSDGIGEWTETTLDAFWKQLSAEQRKLIQYTLKKGPVTIKQLIEYLGKNNGIEVAGLLAAITRHGHSAAGEASLPVIGTVRNENGKCYQVSPEVRERLEQFLLGEAE